MVAAQSYRALNWWLSFHGAREMLAWSSDAPSLQNNFIRSLPVGSLGGYLKSSKKREDQLVFYAKVMGMLAFCIY